MTKKKKETRSEKTIHMDINAEYYDVILDILMQRAKNSTGWFVDYREVEQLVDIIRAFKDAEYYSDKAEHIGETVDG